MAEMRSLKADVKCKVVHICKKMTLGPAEQRAEKIAHGELWKSLISASELIICVPTVQQRGVISLQEGTVQVLLSRHLHVTQNILLRFTWLPILLPRCSRQVVLTVSSSLWL